MRVEDGHHMEQYQLPSDAYEASWSLNSLLRRILPSQVLEIVESDLHRFSRRISSGEIEEVGRLAEGEHYEPRLVQYDHYGRRVDRLETSEGWRKLKDIAAEEGIVGIAYERKTGEYARVHQFAKIFLWVGDSRVVGCPMSMTDGAARVIEQLGTPTMKSLIYPRLISRTPGQSWTAGQFMTEKPGGSDVSRTETSALRASGQTGPPQAGDEYLLDGFKWFSSATDGEVALSLARTGPEGSGSSGLSLFLLPLKAESLDPSAPHSNNGIHLHRLKHKIGTRAVPTAELSLTSSRGYLVGRPGEGVRNIAAVLNITRMHSAFHSLGSVARALQIATAYAQVRTVQDNSTGRYVLLKDLPIHANSLLDPALFTHALTHLLVPLALLLGKSETGKATPGEELRLRLLTPVAKAYAGVRASMLVQDCIEALGGLGYMEEEPLSRLMRDSLVERIWEGTSSVLALDVCRVIERSKGRAMDDYFSWADSIVKAAPDHPSLARLTSALQTLSQASLSLLSPQHPDPRLPRALLELLGHTSCSLGMVEQATWASRTPAEQGDAELEWELVRRWVGRGEGLRKALEGLVQAKGGAEELRLEGEIVYRTGGIGRAKL